MPRNKDNSNGVTLDKSVNLGNMLTILIIVVGALAAHYSMAAKVDGNTSGIEFNKERIKGMKDQHDADREDVKAYFTVIREDIQRIQN